MGLVAGDDDYDGKHGSHSSGQAFFQTLRPIHDSCTIGRPLRWQQIDEPSGELNSVSLNNRRDKNTARIQPPSLSSPIHAIFQHANQLLRNGAARDLFV
jgi:hypothetical protein